MSLYGGGPEKRTGLRRAQYARRQAIAFALATPGATAFPLVPSRHLRPLQMHLERRLDEERRARMAMQRTRQRRLITPSVTPSVGALSPTFHRQAAKYRQMLDTETYRPRPAVRPQRTRVAIRTTTASVAATSIVFTIPSSSGSTSFSLAAASSVGVFSVSSASADVVFSLEILED